MSEIQEQDHSVSCQRISAVPVTAGAIEMMRSESLELLDEYDAAALQLGRMQIPLRKNGRPTKQLHRLVLRKWSDFMIARALHA